MPFRASPDLSPIHRGKAGSGMPDLRGLDLGAGKPRPYEKIDRFSTLATWIDVSYYLFRSVKFLIFLL